MFYFNIYILGLSFSIGIIWAIFVSIVIAVLFIVIGIIIGSVSSEKAFTGVVSIVVQLACFTSGMYFPREMLGDGFAKVCEFLPFESCLVILKGILNGDLGSIELRNLVFFGGYVVVAFAVAVMVFRRMMVRDK